MLATNRQIWEQTWKSFELFALMLDLFNKSKPDCKKSELCQQTNKEYRSYNINGVVPQNCLKKDHLDKDCGECVCVCVCVL